MTSGNREKILELLGVGLPVNVVASAVGVTDGYVSGLASEPEFAEQVQKLRLQNLTEATSRDKKYNSLEDKLLEKIEYLLPMLTNPQQILRALQVVNNAIRRGSPAELVAAPTHQHVHLHLPQAVAQKFIVNGQSQVVEVGGRTIATMSARDVVKKLEELKAVHQEGGQHHDQDANSATERLKTIQRLTHLPVADVM